MSNWGGNNSVFWAGASVQTAEDPFSYAGGQITRFDATYCYHIFTNSLVAGLVPIVGRILPTTIDVFLVAGGGIGQSTVSGPQGGGAGGEAKLVLGHPAPVTTQLVNIGSGGTIFNGGEGTNTSFNGLSATRGRGGGTVTPGVGGVNGTFGGGTANGNAGGGGAGSAAAGSNAASSSVAGAGGPGTSNDWRTGIARLYGRGGPGGSAGAGVTQPAVALATAGDGGPSRNNLDSAGFGSNGELIIRYLRQY